MVKTELNWGLGPVTERETDLARKWLGKRGALVAKPRRLLAVRLGMRHRQSVYFRYAAIFGVPAIAGVICFQMLQRLPNVDGSEMTESISFYFAYFVFQLTMWRTLGNVDRKLAVHDDLVDLSRPRQPWWRVLGGWYLAATAVTFVGGAALGVAMVVTTPARTYAWSWLGLLAIGASCTTVVLTSVLRAPAIAVDEPTRAVDDHVRAENADGVLPAMLAIPVGMDLLNENRQPPAFTGWLIGYLVLAVGLQAIGVVQRSRKVLPPGHYGVPGTRPLADDMLPR